MRIIAGAYRGVRLASLGRGDPAAHLRPTPDRVRESLFNVLNSRLDWEGLRVLDLFAGTGALGLEALSRGADSACFVENGRRGASLIMENITKLRIQDRAELIRRDATRLGASQTAYDLVFLDPPYGKGLVPKTLIPALASNWIARDALICAEDSEPIAAPDGFDLVDQRSFGTSHITFLTPRG